MIALAAMSGSMTWAAAPADESTAAQSRWATRSFHLPGDLPWSLQQLDKDLPPPEALQPPAADAGEEAWANHVRDSTHALRKYFENLGLKLPVGTAFAMDPHSRTFAAHMRAEELNAVEVYVQTLARHQPVHLVFQLNVVQADGALLRRLMADSATHGDLGPQWKALRELVDQGKARLLDTARLEARSGEKVSVESGAQHSRSIGFRIDAQGRAETKQERMNSGLRLELDPVIGPDRVSVDLSFAFTYDFAPPIERMIVAGKAGPLGRIEVPVTDYRRAEIDTSMHFYDGYTRLLGVWKPEGVPELEKQDVLQAAFLKVDCVGLHATDNPGLAAALDRVAEKVFPPPANIKDRQITLPPNMRRRVMHVPFDLLELAPSFQEGEPAPPVDPFAPRLPARHPGSENPLLYTREFLQSAGVAFPEGASAFFNVRTHNLTLVTTPEGLDQVEAFIGTINYCGGMNAMIHTLHIVQADGQLLRQIAERTATNPDCRGSLEQLEKLAAEGKASFISSQQIETRSGASCHISAGPQCTMVSKFRRTDAHGEMTASLDTEKGGTVVKFDSVMGPDGYTMDVQGTLEHHFLPPIAPNADSKNDSGGRDHAMAPPATETRAATTKFATTFGSGATRLIGLWKPEGVTAPNDKDVLQAAFLTVTYLSRDREETP